MSNEKVLTNTRNMRAELLVDPHATRKHFVVFFGVPLEFSALSLFRVFDWAAKSPIHSGGRVLFFPYLSMYWILNSTLQVK